MEKKPTELAVALEQAATPDVRPSSVRHRYLAVTIVLVSVVIAAATVAAVLIVHKHQDKEDFDTVSKVRDRKVPEHVRVDFQNEVIYVSNKQEGAIDGLRALHVYGRGMLAFKDLTNNKCYIDRLNMTFREGLSMWQGFEGKDRTLKSRYFRYIEQPIDSDVLRTFGGDLIAEHCSDVPSHWIVELPEGAINSEKESFYNKTAEFICGPRNVIFPCPCQRRWKRKAMRPVCPCPERVPVPIDIHREADTLSRREMQQFE